jgi:hypothetical protein
METTRRETSTSEKQSGNERTVERHEVTTVKDNTPRKAYRLREGRRHFQDGFAVVPGDEVQLTQDQARAFGDKFEPVDDSDFKTGEYTSYRPGEKKSKSKSGDEPEEPEEGPQGGAPPQPPQKIGVGPVFGGITDPLKDPTAVRPDRQGQQSNEQRRLIDSGGAPPPKAMDVPPLDEQRAEAAGRTVPGGAGKSTETGKAAPSGAATKRETESGPGGTHKKSE